MKRAILSLISLLLAAAGWAQTNRPISTLPLATPTANDTLILSDAAGLAKRAFASNFWMATQSPWTNLYASNWWWKRTESPWTNLYASNWWWKTTESPWTTNALTAEERRQYTSPAPLVPAPLSIPTWDRTNTVTHFNVVRTTNDIAGCRYWAAYTTFPPVARERIEVACSPDGVLWRYPVSSLSSNCTPHAHGVPDPDIFQHSDGSLVVIAPAGTASPAYHSLAYSSTTNGYTWSSLVTALTDSGGTYGLVSPKLVRAGSTLRLYYGKTTSASTATLRYADSVDGTLTNWTTPADCTLPSGWTGWHFEIQYAGGGWHLWWTKSGGQNWLAYAVSTNGVTWELRSTMALRPQTQWDAYWHYKLSALPRTNHLGLVWDCWLSFGYPTSSSPSDPWGVLLLPEQMLPNDRLQVVRSRSEFFDVQRLRQNTTGDALTTSSSDYQWRALRTIDPGVLSGWPSTTIAWLGTNVTFGSSRGVYLPTVWPDVACSNFLVTAYLVATNSVTFYPYAYVGAINTNGAPVANSAGGSTNWTYTSTSTNIMTHQTLITLNSGTTGPVWVTWGVAKGESGANNLATPLMLLGVRIDYW